MASIPTQEVYDGQLDFSGGQDASKTPDKVPENAVYSCINTTFKNGSLQPRPGLVLQDITFPDEVLVVDGQVTPFVKTIFHSGKFQALIPYIIDDVPYLIIIISGTVYLINQNTMVAQVLSLPGGDRLNEYSSRINWALASRFLVIFDFPNIPVIVEGITIRRANLAADEVPISNLGAYNQNRLFIANAGNEFTGGDPTGSLAAPDAPITFLEVETVGSPYFGQIFQLPTNYINAPITAMGFLELVDTSTGIGPLIIATNNQIFSANTQNPRSTWEQGQFVQSIVSNAGIAGPQAMVNVNSDLFFVSSDGQLRTLSMSRNEQSKWSKVPISKEVQNWLKYYDKSLVQFASLGYFSNRIFMTANPYRVNARTLLGDSIVDYTNGGLVAIELDDISTLRSESPPIWGGLWTGVRPMDICNNFERCFVVSKDEQLGNTLWEVDPEISYDKSGSKIRYVRSRVYTRNYVFNDPFTAKNLLYVELPFQNIEGDFKVNLDYKPGNSPNFLPWGEMSFKVPWRTCTVDNSCNFNGFSPADINGFRFGSPNSPECDPVTGNLYRWLRKAQLRLTIESLNWELPYFKMKAVTKPRTDTDTTCEQYPTVSVCKDCNDDWVIPPFDGCVEKET